MAVVVFAGLHSERSSRRGRRPTRLPAGAVQPDPVPITRVTVIAAEPFADEASAQDWLKRCGGRGEAGSDEIVEALTHVNLAIAAYRAAAADPHAHDVSRDQAVRVRVGYGSGSKLVDGAWDDCLTLPPEHGRPRVRRRMLSPEEELAGILTGRRSSVQPSEELLLRARLDLDGGRHVEAAMQVLVACETLNAELSREGSAGSAVAGRVEIARRVSQAAILDGLTPEHMEELETLVTELEGVVRRRRYAQTE